jgi:hypothetical protein
MHLSTQQVEHCARLLIERGYTVDVTYTSRLKRAIRSSWIILRELGDFLRLLEFHSFFFLFSLVMCCAISHVQLFFVFCSSVSDEMIWDVAHAVLRVLKCSTLYGPCGAVASLQFVHQDSMLSCVVCLVSSRLV